jgi:DNA-binding IclR family transcriptional regulator
MTTPHPGAPERSVVDRTLSVLGAFDRDNRTLTLSDISRRSGLPVATAHRIVNKLHGWGALERSNEGGYSIGLRLWETGTLAPRCSPLVEAAQPHLMELNDRTSAKALLMIRDGVEGVCLSFVTKGPNPWAPWGDSGSRMPLHATSAGLVLLAHASEVVQKEVCAGPLHAYTPATLTEGAALRRALAKVRREGYAVTNGMLTSDCAGVAFPVRNRRGTVVAAVCAVAGADIFQATKLAPHVSAAADALSQHVRTSRWRMARVGA